MWQKYPMVFCRFIIAACNHFNIRPGSAAIKAACSLNNFCKGILCFFVMAPTCVKYAFMPDYGDAVKPVVTILLRFPFFNQGKSLLYLLAYVSPVWKTGRRMDYISGRSNSKNLFRNRNCPVMSYLEMMIWTIVLYLTYNKAGIMAAETEWVAHRNIDLYLASF